MRWIKIFARETELNKLGFLPTLVFMVPMAILIAIIIVSAPITLLGLGLAIAVTLAVVAVTVIVAFLMVVMIGTIVALIGGGNSREDYILIILRRR